MKTILCLAVAVSLTGCAAFEKIAPQTVAGFKANGIVGAADAMSGAVIAICEDLDGNQIRVAIDGLADTINASSAADRVRSAREQVCKVAGGAKDVTEALTD